MTSTLVRVITATALTAVLGFGAVSCGGGDDSSGDAPDGDLTPAERGENVARSQGCAGCHGEDFDGAAGPGWIGLAGSEVTLSDGSTVIADDEYLTRAIADPSAQLTDGYTLKMPANNVSDEQIVDIVAFINSLADG